MGLYDELEGLLHACASFEGTIKSTLDFIVAHEDASLEHISPPETILTPNTSDVPFALIETAISNGCLVFIGYGSTKLSEMKWLEVKGADAITGKWNVAVSCIGGGEIFDIEARFKMKPEKFIEAVTFRYKQGA
jgi:hypothetical protein